jgi:hypothetical protein
VTKIVGNGRIREHNAYCNISCLQFSVKKALG